MRKKLLKWQLVNHPDRGGSAERSAAMNERVALFAKAVEVAEERLDNAPLERRLAKKREKEEGERSEQAAATAAEALSRSLKCGPVHPLLDGDCVGWVGVAGRASAGGGGGRGREGR